MDRTKGKRMYQEISLMLNDPYPGISGGPVGENIRDWKASIVGPIDTPYEGGFFFLEISFPEDYPFVPPKVKFLTKIYHCNIDLNGDINIDILKQEGWSPALTIDKVLLSIAELLEKPNPQDPNTQDVAKLLMSNKKQHDEVAREWTQRYASKIPIHKP